MVEFGYQDISDIKVNTKPFKNTETIMTLTNPYNDKKIIIEYDKECNIIRMIAPSLSEDIEFIKYDDDIELIYSIGDNIIICLRYKTGLNQTGLNQNATWIIYDKKFRLLKEYHNNTLILEYHYQD